MEDTNYKVALSLMLKSMEEGHYEANQLVNHQRILTLGPTPPVLLAIGLQPLPIAMTGKVVDKCYFDHGVTKSTLEKAYQIIASPKALYKSTSVGCLIMTYEIRRANPLIVAIHPQKQLGGRKDFYNSVASIYYKENDPETRWVKQGLLLWSAPQK